MAMTFAVGNVSRQRQFSDLDARLDREAARSRNRGRARAASIDDVSLANDLAGMRWSMGTHAGHAPVAAPATPASPAPTPAPEATPPMPSLLLPTEPAPTPSTVKLIDARELAPGDVVVLTEVRAPTTLSEKRVGDAPPSRTLLSLGSGQVAEPFGSGVVVRSVAEAIAAAVTAIAFRPAAIVTAIPGDDSAPSNLLAYLGHLRVPTSR
jgi:hypothetical protein